MAGVDAWRKITRVLVGDKAMGPPSGHLAPAHPGTGEESVRHVVEAPPEDGGRVRRVGHDKVSAVEQHGDGVVCRGVRLARPQYGPVVSVGDGKVAVGGDDEF